MATEQKQPDPEDDMDEPTEEEIEQQKRSAPDWKHPTMARNCRSLTASSERLANTATVGASMLAKASTMTRGFQSTPRHR